MVKFGIFIQFRKAVLYILNDQIPKWSILQWAKVFYLILYSAVSFEGGFILGNLIFPKYFKTWFIFIYGPWNIKFTFSLDITELFVLFRATSLPFRASQAFSICFHPRWLLRASQIYLFIYFSISYYAITFSY